jgi:hypothetical protein
VIPTIARPVQLDMPQVVDVHAVKNESDGVRYGQGLRELGHELVNGLAVPACGVAVGKASLDRFATRRHQWLAAPATNPAWSRIHRIALGLLASPVAPFAIGFRDVRSDAEVILPRSVSFWRTSQQGAERRYSCNSLPIHICKRLTWILPDSSGI